MQSLYRVWATLSQQSGLTYREIAERSQCAGSMVARAMRRLVDLGYVEMPKNKQKSYRVVVPFVVRPAATFGGITTLYGWVVDVQRRAPASVTLRTTEGSGNESDMVCRASQRLARVLARRLSELVVLHGHARWRHADLTMVDFRITSIEPFPDDDTSYMDAFAALHALPGGAAWDGVNVEAWMREERGEGVES